MCVCARARVRVRVCVCVCVCEREIEERGRGWGSGGTCNETPLVVVCLLLCSRGTTVAYRIASTSFPHHPPHRPAPCALTSPPRSCPFVPLAVPVCVAHISTSRLSPLSLTHTNRNTQTHTQTPSSCSTALRCDTHPGAGRPLARSVDVPPVRVKVVLAHDEHQDEGVSEVPGGTCGGNDGW